MKLLSILCTSAITIISVNASAAEPIISLNGSLYTSVSASSFYSANYLPQNLFLNPSPTVGVQLNENDPGQTFAGLGAHSDYVEFELDQAYDVSSFYYAQRDYADAHNPNVDKVTSMRIWASSVAPFAAADPGTAPDATANPSPNIADTFVEYALGSTITGRYFLFHLTNPSYDNTNNSNGFIGGSELRLGGVIAVPEPSSLACLGIALLGLASRRSR